MLDQLISCGDYEGALEESIKALKYGFRKQLAPLLAKELAVASVRLKRRPDVITWVPMHDRQLRWRGFNHSELLARELAKIVGIPARPLLTKCRQTAFQVSLSPIARAGNVVGCFELAPQADVAGKRVAIVDDVVLSGATLQEAAKVLRRAGAKSVYGLVLAISPQHEEIVKRIRQRIPNFGR